MAVSNIELETTNLIHETNKESEIQHQDVNEAKHDDDDDDEEEIKKTRTRDMLNSIYDEILSEEEDAYNHDDQDKVEKETEKETETGTERTSQDTKDNVNDIIMDELYRETKRHESLLDTTMGHGERMDNIYRFIDYRIILQVFIAVILATITYYIEFGIWRLFQISQCEDDIVYLSWNTLKYSIFEAWQNGFCFLFGFIYLLSATIIDFHNAAELGIHEISIRKIRIYILCLTTIIGVIISFFISFYDILLYNLRLPIFNATVVILYYLLLCKYRKIVTKQSYYILMPAAAFVVGMALIFSLGLLIAFLFQENEYLFATIYPIIITLAQSVSILVMKNYHYILCCCCKQKYVVTTDYDPNSYYEPQPILERFVCDENGGNVNETELYQNRNICFVDGRAVEYLWMDEWIYFICGLIIVFTESMRISGLLALKNNMDELILSCIISLIMEVLQRNNLIWEILYRLILRKQNPERTKFDAIYFGAKYSWEYLPILLLLHINLIQYGPSIDCYKTDLNELYKLITYGNDEYMNNFKYWWVFVIIFGFEIATDLMSEFVSWILRESQCIPVLFKDDGARKVILIRMGVFGWTAMFITAIQVSINGMESNLTITNMLNGNWNLVDSYFNLFTV